MPTIDNATDADLRLLTYKHDFVIVKFIDDDCAVCKELAPSFQNFAESPAYKDVLFLKVEAKENPVAVKEVQLSGTPFIVTYKKGVLKECKLITEEAGIRQMLDSLLLA